MSDNGANSDRQITKNSLKLIISCFKKRKQSHSVHIFSRKIKHLEDLEKLSHTRLYTSNIIKQKKSIKFPNECISIEDISLKSKTEETIPSFFQIKYEIMNNCLSKHSINYLTTSLDNDNRNSNIKEFLAVLKEKNNFLNFTMSSGVINSIKQLLEFFQKFSYEALEDFIQLFIDNIEVMIYDKTQHKLIEQILKSKALSNHTSKALKKLKLYLIKNIHVYSFNEIPCHCVKVYFSVSQLSEEEYNLIYQEIKSNFLQLTQNQCSSSLLISSLYVRIYILSF